MYPQQSPTTHTEQLGDEVAVYDRARAQVHALNPTAACVWRQCDGATSPDAMAAALARDRVPEAEAVVDLTLRELARLHLLESPVDSRADRPARTRRWLLGRGVAAAMLPAVYSIAAPSPVDAQSLPPPPGAPTLTSVSPNDGLRGETVAVTLTGTNFVVGATTVNVGGGGVTVNDVVVGSSTSLTASFVLDLTTAGPRVVTVRTAGGRSGGRTFTINAEPGSETFTSVGTETLTVPDGVVRVTIEASGGSGVAGFGDLPGAGGLGGQTRATVSVSPGALLTVHVGGAGLGFVGGFNGGGGSTGVGGGGGGASDVYQGATPLVIAGGGGGGGAEAGGRADPGGDGGDGGGLIADPGESPDRSGGGGGGGTQEAGGAGGDASPGSSSGTPGTAGVAGEGGISGTHQPGVIGGGGGGGGYFGGGGGGGGNPSTAGAAGGGGGSSFAAPGAKGVVHEKGVNSGDGSVTISW